MGRRSIGTAPRGPASSKGHHEIAAPLCEGLEPRLLLSATLPELHLVGPAVDRFDGQVVYLDFDGADGVTYDGPVTVNDIDVPAFSTAGLGCDGRDARLERSIAAQVAIMLSPLGVSVVAGSRPDGEHSTIYIGGTADTFADYGHFLGLAEAVDAGNTNRQDNAFVFSDEMISVGASFGNVSRAIAGVAVHEVGHLLGLSHLAEDAQAHNALDAVAQKQVVHQHIMEEAVALFSDRFPGVWQDTDFDFSGTEDFAGRMRTAVDEEDSVQAPWGGDYYSVILAPFREHFFDPDEPDSSDHLDEIWGIDINPDNESALDRAELYWPDYVMATYAAGSGNEAWYYLGRVAHLIGDMTTPAHVHLDPHGNIGDIGLLVGDDNYEDYMVEYDDDYANHYNYELWDAEDVTGTIPGFTSLESLFRTVAEDTDDYDSDAVDGEFSGSQDINWGEVDYEYCRIYADTLMPNAITYTASLLKMFVDGVKPTLSGSAPAEAFSSVLVTVDPQGTGSMGFRQVEFEVWDGNSWIPAATDSSPSGGWNGTVSLTSFPVGQSVDIRARALDDGGLYSDWSTWSVLRSTPVQFADADLEQAVRDALGMPTGDLMPSVLATLTDLDASSRNIASLEGLEYCTNLAFLNLSSNQIADISPLVANAGLASGDEVHLSNNPLSYEAVQLQISALEVRGVSVSWDSAGFVPDIDVELPAQADDVASFDFEETQIGQNISQTFTVRNEGMADLIVEQASGLAEPFSLAPVNDTANPADDWTILPGATMTFDVTFAPTGAGNYDGALPLVSDDPDETSYALTVTGTAVDVGGDLNGDGFVGQGDLDIALGNWGQSVPPGDPRADPSGDDFVGQGDLDIVLANWGQGVPLPPPTTAGEREAASSAYVAMTDAPALTLVENEIEAVSGMTGMSASHRPEPVLSSRLGRAPKPVGMVTVADVLVASANRPARVTVRPQILRDRIETAAQLVVPSEHVRRRPAPAAGSVKAPRRYAVALSSSHPKHEVGELADQWLDILALSPILAPR